MKRPIAAVAVGIGVALMAPTSPASAQSARVDAGVRSSDAEFRITLESGASPWSRDARRVGVDCVRCEPRYDHDQERYYEEAWYELPEYERERLKDLRESRREWRKDQREREREYLKRQRELERDFR